MALNPLFFLVGLACAGSVLPLAGAGPDLVPYGDGGVKGVPAAVTVLLPESGLGSCTVCNASKNPFRGSDDKTITCGECACANNEGASIHVLVEGDGAVNGQCDDNPCHGVEDCSYSVTVRIDYEGSCYDDNDCDLYGEGSPWPEEPQAFNTDQGGTEAWEVELTAECEHNGSGSNQSNGEWYIEVFCNSLGSGGGNTPVARWSAKLNCADCQ